MSILFLMAALGAQAAEAGPRIEVAQADWRQFERISSRLSVPTNRMTEQVQRILREGECRLPRQSAREFNITVNWAMRLDQANQPQRIVVQDVGCRAIETLVGGIVNDMVRYNYFNMPAAGTGRWYASSINFNLAS